VKKYARLRLLFVALVALAVLAITAKAFCPRRERLDTRGWDLPELVEHLQDRGLPLRVVPSRENGQWGDNVYLTEDPAATWETFQLKNQTAQRIGQWRRSVWVHRIGPSTDVEWRLLQWEGCGCRVAGFLVFGDPGLIERIKEAFPSRYRAG
jgi:hypothetical protein